PAGADEPLAVSLVAAFAMTLPLALRRRRPVGVLVFVVLASIVSVVSRVLPVNGAVVTYLAIALALHPAAASLSRSRAVLALVGSLAGINRSEEHTSELQSRENLVCRLLLEKKKE